MRAIRRFLKRAASWTRTEQDERRLRTEIEEHLACETAENIRRGLTPDEARRQAALKFGAVQAMSEDYRELKGLPFFETLLQDSRLALRRLRKSPAFAITTVLTLALGIGPTTSIFTLVHAVLFQSLAVSNPADLYRLGRETLCCLAGGYGQPKGFLIAAARRVRTDRSWITAGLAIILGGGAFSGTPTLWRESLRSWGDYSCRAGFGICGAHGGARACVPCKFHLACAGIEG